MQLTEEKNIRGHLIKQYTPGEFRIDGISYTHSLIVSPTQVLSWEPQSFSQIKNNHLEEILKLNPEIIILGTGASQHFFESHIVASIIQENIGFEVMNTLAACCTYNLLASENRRVVAGLIIQ